MAPKPVQDLYDGMKAHGNRLFGYCIRVQGFAEWMPGCAKILITAGYGRSVLALLVLKDGEPEHLYLGFSAAKGTGEGVGIPVTGDVAEALAEAFAELERTVGDAIGERPEDD